MIWVLSINGIYSTILIFSSQDITGIVSSTDRSIKWPTSFENPSSKFVVSLRQGHLVSEYSSQGRNSLM